ncbi:venom carboxylesterase-6-like [Culicoides brevitarsis]|uniref:venom carboxylesterase-6-like n=1 Tax=Culicoides brevitarsis TaxID=469753 RepID=UPI00307C835F
MEKLELRVKRNILLECFNRYSKMFISVLLLLLTISISTALDPVVVQTENGPYRSDPRLDFHAFEGIRYAEPPIGDLRFADPVPYTKIHADIWNASKPGSECIQYQGTVNGDEDCLFINIYTQEPDKEAKLPVIVHIHGGGFIYGQGAEWGPEHLIKRKVVFVTFNYRLGLMGFLSAGASGMTGNMGLKDQVMALKWIQRNIEAFGGDPDNVMIVGWSAGAASVQFHYISPMSKGLFSKGIAHSGSVFNPWVWQSSPEWRFHVICKKFECDIDDHPFTKSIECLKQISAKDLVQMTGDPIFQPFEGNPFNPFGVVLEADSINSFISESPKETFSKGEVQLKPLIIAAVRDEGYYPGAEFLANPELLTQINEDFDNILPHILHFPVFSNETKENITKIIRERYLGKVPILEETFTYFVKILTDSLFLAGIHESIEQFSPLMPTYIYGFDFKTEYGFGEFLSGRNKVKGIAHGEDMVLIYDTSLRSNIPFTLEEQLVMGHLLDIYESFAYTSIPKIGGKNLEPTPSLKKSITFTHIRGPNNYSTVTTENLDKFTEKLFWGKIREILDNSSPQNNQASSISTFCPFLVTFSILFQLYSF